MDEITETIKDMNGYRLGTCSLNVIRYAGKAVLTAENQAGPERLMLIEFNKSLKLSI